MNNRIYVKGHLDRKLSSEPTDTHTVDRMLYPAIKAVINNKSMAYCIMIPSQQSPKCRSFPSGWKTVPKFSNGLSHDEDYHLNLGYISR